MATQNEILERLDTAATNAENATDAYNEVLKSEGEQDIPLVDGTTTPNLNKRIKNYVTAVKSVQGKTGEIVLTPSDIMTVGSRSLNETPSLDSVPEIVDSSGTRDPAANAQAQALLNIIGYRTSAENITIKNGRKLGDFVEDVITPYDFGAIGKNISAPVSDWYTIGSTNYRGYSNLAAVQVDYPHVTSASDYIDWAALQAWWSDISQNRRRKASCDGEFVCNKGIANTNTPTSLFKTKIVEFGALIKYVGVIDRGFSILSARQTYFCGNLELHGSGGAVYADRQTNVLLYIQDSIQAKWDWFVNLRFAKYWGMVAFSSVSPTVLNNNVSDFGKMQFYSCGRRFSQHNATFTSRSDTGTSNSTSQRTQLTLSANHGLDLTVGFIKYNNKPYSIQSYTENTLTVYPCLSETDTTGSIQLNAGGDYRVYGQDSNMIRLNSHSSDCAICNGAMGFYVGKQDGRGNEFNDIGLCLGNGINNVSANGVWMGYYGEGNVFDFVKTSITDDKTIVFNPINSLKSKCYELLPIDLTTRKVSPYLGSFLTWYEGDKIYRQKPYQFRDGTNPTTTITVDQTTEFFKLRANSAIITLSDDADHRRLFRNVDIEFEIFGTASNNGTSGNTTLKCQAGYTINGSSSDLIIPAANSAFKVSARLVNNVDWRVSIYYASRRLEATVVYDPASLAPNEVKSWNVTLTGSVKGDTVVASFDGNLNGTVLMSAQVTSNNLVTVWHWNPTASAVDVASGNLKVKLV